MVLQHYFGYCVKVLSLLELVTVSICQIMSISITAKIGKVQAKALSNCTTLGHGKNLFLVKTNLK